MFKDVKDLELITGSEENSDNDSIYYLFDETLSSSDSKWVQKNQKIKIYIRMKHQKNKVLFNRELSFDKKIVP